ncbi:hypothetical protein [Streptomyces sp. NPDC012466]|uniref:hypothetical protein n=1 Tax=Streptomyces sp. NPDC012466 TaxID=3364835 RepID=UPI0036E8F842
MFRGTTVRTVVSVIAAALFALQLFAPTASFASAHTHGQAEANAQPGTKPSGKSSRPGHKLLGKALRDETATCRAGHHGDPTGPLRTRDRSHTASAPTAPERPLHRHILPTTPEAAGPAAAHHRTSRSSTSHTPAALQVYRC